MKRKLIAAIGVATMIAGIAACGSDKKDDKAAEKPADQTGTVTVWLMAEAQTAWPELVQNTTAQFKAKYPKVNVKIQYQQWSDKVQKLDAALSGSSAPDVVELGNTETQTYILNGALAELDKKSFQNSDTWIKGLEDTCTYQGKLYCAPYYAGARVAIYNTADFKAGTGSDAFPATEDELTAALDKIEAKKGGDKTYSPLYLPGQYWYAAMSYVKAYGGQIAKTDGTKWTGDLESPQAQQGIQHFIDLVKKYNHGDQTKDEADHANVMAHQKAGVIYGNGWEAGSVITPPNGNAKLKDVIKTATMPGPNGKALPSFIGGSDLAVVNKSKVKDLAKEWIADFTDEKNEAALVTKQTLPNNTKQLEPMKADPATAAAANAVPDAWFTPIAPGWAAIEKQGILKTMLLDILKGKSVADATKAADDKINSLINTAS
ncbi:extracellular solute-binding protein [Actinacidiphila alni]|uniref:Carbohydrate ABC transporter substrate-binding protein, CUT1 family n=1 Tax=Actinacidiphila alni TaxID=380248 RepID=A0A1I2I600_9ACTN|nr:extracellular solute-binding protein [Actinacidiphila alni]SFF37043.1 carbohydrate ABC transporter substrate-binding protein, CUT1 family [Actinacidiphila alni]